MFALFIEVNADDSHVEQARTFLPEVAVPGAKQQGAIAGYWLAPAGGRGLSVTVYDTESEAAKAASGFTVGQVMGPVEGVTCRTVEVREVLAHL